MSEMTCPACGTRYTIPASGSLLCPNNNCPRHLSPTPSGSVTQQVVSAVQEAETWDLAVKRAEAALEDARQNAAAARARIATILSEAQRKAEADLEAIKSMRPGIGLVKGA